MKRFSGLVLLLVVLGFLSHTEAALIDRGGGLIYDSVLNVTWLQDANYAKNSGYGDGSGQMTWQQANAWASNLEYFDTVRKVNLTEWRLPHILPINGSNYNLIYLNDGLTDEGSNISAPGTIYAGNTGSEMAYMFYNNLHNISYWDLAGNGGQNGWGLQNTFPFINLQANLPNYVNADIDSPRWNAFKTAFMKDHNGMPPFSLSTNYYDAMFMIKEAIEKTGVTGDPSKLKEERKKIADYCANVKNFQGLMFSWDMKDGEPTNKPLFIFEIQGGKKKLVKEIKLKG